MAYQQRMVWRVMVDEGEPQKDVEPNQSGIAVTP